MAKIQPIATEKVFVRLTAGQVAAVRALGQVWTQREPGQSHRWLHSDGSTNVSAVLRDVLASRIEGFHQL